MPSALTPRPARGSRTAAVRTMLRALDEFVVEGVRSTIPIQREILAHGDFLAASHDTGFVERYFGRKVAT